MEKMKKDKTPEEREAASGVLLTFLLSAYALFFSASRMAK